MAEGGKAGEIRVNRAPVLTLWAAVVAERLGHDPDAAMTLGRAVAGSSARVKARAIGLETDQHEGDKRETDMTRATTKPAEHCTGPARTVHLLGRDVPVAEGEGGLRALDHGRPASPGPARAYVERAFGANLPAVRRAMERLAAALPPEELNRVGFRLYERFRPEVPEGARGWGAKGVLDLERIEDAR
jgi:hypothetical protein